MLKWESNLNFNVKVTSKFALTKFTTMLKPAVMNALIPWTWRVLHNQHLTTGI